MQFREIEHKGFTIRLCDLPPTPLYDSKGQRKGKAMKNRHWKVMKNKETVTTAMTLQRAKDKATMLALHELFSITKVANQ